ncbi:hypothetical protein BC834DRAFT_904489 [Gloeopeniophorella convolvens]|nr:hypothetical protein BC834DRAFT_904489 [Gloeopeniophorella convolvens]
MLQDVGLRKKSASEVLLTPLAIGHRLSGISRSAVSNDQGRSRRNWCVVCQHIPYSFQYEDNGIHAFTYVGILSAPNWRARILWIYHQAPEAPHCNSPLSRPRLTTGRLRGGASIQPHRAYLGLGYSVSKRFRVRPGPLIPPLTRTASASHISTNCRP